MKRLTISCLCLAFHALVHAVPGKSFRFKDLNKHTDVLTKSEKHLRIFNRINSADFPSLNSAVNIAGSAAAALIIDRKQILKADLIIPANITLIVKDGGCIDNAGHTIIINGTIVANPGPIFLGEGFVSGLSKASPEWWQRNKVPGVTDMKLAIQSAVNSLSQKGGEVVFRKTIYYIKGINSRRLDGVQIKSNITFRGVGFGTEIRQSVDCYNLFFTQYGKPITDPNQSIQVKNVKFYGIRFTQPVTPAQWASEKHLLNFGSITGLTVKNCYFTGFCSDAMQLGFNLSDDLRVVYPAIVRNIVISQNVFDGINKNNRNAISIICGQSITISHNKFKNTTRNDMPGAIDIEPEGSWPVISDVSIEDNSFENIGGHGAVLLIFTAVLKKAPSNIKVTGNTFNGITAPYYYRLIGPPDEPKLSSYSPENIVFKGNTHIKGSKMLTLEGAKKSYESKRSD